MIKYLLRRFQQEPFLVVPGLLALLNGQWHKWKFKLLCKNVQIGRLPRIYGKLIVRGPGKIVIGDNLYIDSLSIKQVCFMTHRPSAQIVIGNGCGFNGTSIQCFEKIQIDDLSNIANAYIVDSPAHKLLSNRRANTNQDVATFPVHIEKNVWISVNVTILHGVTIGQNSVIGACSLVRKDVQNNCFAAGNPLMKIKNIDE